MKNTDFRAKNITKDKDSHLIIKELITKNHNKSKYLCSIKTKL